MTNKRKEINPGEFFLITDKVILIDEYESILGSLKNFGYERNEVAYMFSFQGKLNHKEERDEVTIIMPIEAAWDLLNDMLKEFELLGNIRNE